MRNMFSKARGLEHERVGTAKPIIISKYGADKMSIDSRAEHKRGPHFGSSGDEIIAKP